MPTTIIFTDAAGRDVETATFHVMPAVAAKAWATRMVALSARTEGAVVTGWRVEVAS